MPHNLMQFLLGLRDRGISYKSMPIYLAAISFQSRAWGIQDFTKEFRVQKMVAGLRRRFLTGQISTPTILHGLSMEFCAMCSSAFESLLFRTVTLLMFYGAFRPSEVLVRSKLVSTDRVLQWGDCDLEHGILSLHLRVSKTDQTGRGQWILLKRAPMWYLCPVSVMEQYFLLAPPEAGWLFRHLDRSPLTIYEFGAIFKRALTHLGLRPELYRLHLFRIGTASVVARIGFSPQDIKRIGRWHSGAFKYYVR